MRGQLVLTLIQLNSQLGSSDVLPGTDPAKLQLTSGAERDIPPTSNHVRAAWFVCHTSPWEIGQSLVHGISRDGGGPLTPLLLALSWVEFEGGRG